jgi:hypothetical protein
MLIKPLFSPKAKTGRPSVDDRRVTTFLREAWGQQKKNSKITVGTVFQTTNISFLSLFSKKPLQNLHILRKTNKLETEKVF